MDLRELRQNKALTISELSSNIKINQRRIKLIERGLDIPTLSEIKKISNYFNDEHIDFQYYQKRKEKIIAGEGYITTKMPNNQIYEPNSKVENKIKVLDLFCGVGGLSYGFEQTMKYTTIGGVDLLEDRIKTFTANHNSSYGFCYNINELSPEKIHSHMGEKPSVIIGGAPCQGFSSIRPFRNLNVNDQRNDLFKSFAIYLKYFKPDWFVFENVVGLLTHKNGTTLKLLINEFSSLGYKVDFKILNSAYYGTPQLRERLILVGNKHNIDFIWPKPTHYCEYKSMAGSNGNILQPNTDVLAAINIMDALSDLPPLLSGEKAEKYLQLPSTNYQEYVRENCDSLTLHESTIHSDKMLNIIRHSGYNIDSVRHLVTSGFSTSYSRLEPNKPSVTLTVNFTNPSSNKCIHPIQDRALTPREGARIQGFPDRFKFLGSKTQIVKQIGNAVPPILSKVIADQIYKYF